MFDFPIMSPDRSVDGHDERRLACSRTDRTANATAPIHLLTGALCDKNNSQSKNNFVYCLTSTCAKVHDRCRHLYV